MLDTSRSSHISEHKRVTKPWGYEIIWAQTENYVAKLMHINPNQRMSLQLHQKKEETIYVNSGTLAVWESKNDEDFKLFNPGSVYHVKPGMVHRFGAKDKAVNLIEVSTNYLEDVVRIADDYKR